MRTRRLMLLFLSAVALTIALLIVFSSGQSVDIFSTYFRRFPAFLFLALALGVLISVGQIDLSAPAAMTLCGLLALSFMNRFAGSIGLVLALLVPAIVLVGLFAVYGELIARKKVTSSLLISISVALLLLGLNQFVHKALSAQGPLTVLLNPNSDPGLARTIASSDLPTILIAPLPYIFLAAAVTFALVLWRYRTRSGLQHVATGESEIGATRAGVDINSVRRLAFRICGVLVLLAWISEYFLHRKAAWEVYATTGYEVFAIASAALGGTRIEGGRFDPASILMASIFVVLTASISGLLKLPTEGGFIFSSIVLILVCLADSKSAARQNFLGADRN